MLTGEVIAIGDELTSGQRLDTNSQWLSQRLAELGIRVLYHTTVGDDLAGSLEVFRRAIQRADVIVASGGLGPTADDLTREALASATARPLELRREALDHIESVFARRQRSMPDQNRRQAMFPMGSRIIDNPHGTAPGIELMLPRSTRPPARVFALPGVPAELKEMWSAHCVPVLSRINGQTRRTIIHRRIKCFGVGESDLEAMLPDLIARGREPTVGITVHKATITLRITASGASTDECGELIRPTEETIRSTLGPLVFGEEDDELQDAIAGQLIEKSQTLCTVEWGTHGTLAKWLGYQRQSQMFYRGGMVFRNPQHARQILSPDLSDSDDQPTFVRQCAVAVRDRFGSDYALVVGPAPDRVSKTERTGHDTIALALASGTGVHLAQKAYSGHPDILVERTAKQALDELRLLILSGG